MKISLVVGAVCILTGILLGNFAIGNITEAAKKETGGERHLFSSGDELDPISPQAARAEALTKYQKSQPDGPLIRRLRIGQILVVAGFLISVIGIFI